MNTAVLKEIVGQVGILTINRPDAMNALNDDVMNGLTLGLDEFEQNDAIHCVIITGSEKVFAAGADIAAMRNYEYIDVYRDNFITRNWERLKTFRKPTIAAVSGYALGGGCEVAMMCDMVFAADNAKFSQPEVKIATLPGAGATQRLPRSVGKAVAMDLCFTGRMLTAAEALQFGLVSRVYPKAELMHETLEQAQAIAAYSLPVLMMMKESLNRAFETPLNEGLAFERKMLYATFALEDRNEGMNAFIEKRPANFNNR